MVRREEFVSRYAALNNKEYLERKVDELESYVDKELLKDNNITKMINSDNLNLSQYTENISTLSQSNAVHNDSSILDNGAGRSGGQNNKEYAIWSSSITDSNSVSATKTPWLNKSLDSTVEGVITIELPENTNKNVALLLIDRYLGPSNLDNLTNAEINKVYGFWRKVPELNASTSDYDDAVTLTWNNDSQRFELNFRLHP